MSSPLKSVRQELDIKSFLHDVDLFNGMPNKDEFLGELSPKMTYQTYSQGENIFEEGKDGESLFILQQGEVYVQKRNPDGDVYNVVILKAENRPAIGEGGLIDRQPRSATVRCKTACAFLVLSRDDFNQFCDQHPRWGLALYRNIFKILIKRLRKMNTDLMLLHKALTTEIRGN